MRRLIVATVVAVCMIGGTAARSYGAAAALELGSDEDARMRDRVLADLGRACSDLVHLKRVVETIPSGVGSLGQSLQPTLDRLRMIADDADSATGAN